MASGEKLVSPSLNAFSNAFKEFDHVSKPFNYVSKTFSHAYNKRSVKGRCSVNGMFTIMTFYKLRRWLDRRLHSGYCSNNGCVLIWSGETRWHYELYTPGRPSNTQQSEQRAIHCVMINMLLVQATRYI